MSSSWSEKFALMAIRSDKTVLLKIECTLLEFEGRGLVMRLTDFDIVFKSADLSRTRLATFWAGFFFGDGSSTLGVRLRSSPCYTSSFVRIKSVGVESGP